MPQHRTQPGDLSMSGSYSNERGKACLVQCIFEKLSQPAWGCRGKPNRRAPYFFGGFFSTFFGLGFSLCLCAYRGAGDTFILGAGLVVSTSQAAPMNLSSLLPLASCFVPWGSFPFARALLLASSIAFSYCQVPGGRTTIRSSRRRHLAGRYHRSEQLLLP